MAANKRQLKSAETLRRELRECKTKLRECEARADAYEAIYRALDVSLTNIAMTCYAFEKFGDDSVKLEALQLIAKGEICLQSQYMKKMHQFVDQDSYWAKQYQRRVLAAGMTPRSDIFPCLEQVKD